MVKIEDTHALIWTKAAENYNSDDVLSELKLTISDFEKQAEEIVDLFLESLPSYFKKEIKEDPLFKDSYEQRDKTLDSLAEMLS